MNNNLLDRKKLEKIAREFLEAVDPNPDREGLKETPRRVADYFIEMLEGQKYSNDEIAEMFSKCFDLEDEPTARVDEKRLNHDLVIESGIHIFSHCEHHLALMYDMEVTIAYIPKDKVIGLSKMARISEMVAKRLQLQERIGADIAYVMKKVLGTNDVAVLISGKHACLSARGIKSRECVTKTSCLNGKFLTSASLRAEMIALGK